jgi:hypothetical protein
MLSCDKCRISKKKCSRDEPCQRCRDKGFECTYEAVTNSAQIIPKTNAMEKRLEELEILFKTYLKLNEGIDINLDSIYSGKSGLKRGFNDISPINLDLISSKNLNSDKLITRHTYSNDQLSYKDLKLYFDTYVQNFHALYPFINLKHLRLLLKLKPLESPILYVIYCIGQFILFRKTKVTPLPNLKDNYFYNFATYLLKTHNQTGSLLNVQSLILLADLELQHGLCNESGFHNVQAIRKLQMEGVYNSPETKYTSSTLMVQREREATWVMTKRVDGFCSSATETPYTVRISREDLDISADNYDSYIFVSTITKRFNRKSFSLSDEELYQYSSYLAMDLYCFSIYHLCSTKKFKKASKNFDTLDKESFISESMDLLECIRLSPLDGIDGEAFNAKFPLDHPQFNIHFANYILFQFEAIGVYSMLVDFLNGAKQYNYPSPPQFESGVDLNDFENVRYNHLQNLIQVLYPSDPVRRKYIEDLTTVDYIFVIPHFFISKAKVPKYSQTSEKLILDNFDKWPCLEAIFCQGDSVKNDDIFKDDKAGVLGSNCDCSVSPPKSYNMSSPTSDSSQFFNAIHSQM